MNKPLNIELESILCDNRVIFFKQKYNISLKEFYNEALKNEITERFIEILKSLKTTNFIYGIKYLRNTFSFIMFSFKVEELIFNFKKK